MTKVWRTFVWNLNPPSSFTAKLSQKSLFAWTNKCNLHCLPCAPRHQEHFTPDTHSTFSLKDSLVGLNFEVSPFLKLVSIFVPAERRTGTPGRLALQVQLVPFDQRLASHQPQLRSRSWTERERKGDNQSHFPSCLAVSGAAHAREKQLKICAHGFRWHGDNRRSEVKVLMGSRVESILISSQACLNDAFLLSLIYVLHLQKHAAEVPVLFLQHNCDIRGANTLGLEKIRRGDNNQKKISNLQCFISVWTRV